MPPKKKQSKQQQQEKLGKCPQFPQSIITQSKLKKELIVKVWLQSYIEQGFVIQKFKSQEQNIQFRQQPTTRHKGKSKQILQQTLQFYFQGKIRMLNFARIYYSGYYCYVFPSGFQMFKFFEVNGLKIQLSKELKRFFLTNKQQYQIFDIQIGNQGQLKVYSKHPKLFWDLDHLYQPIKDFFDPKVKYMFLMLQINPNFDNDLLYTVLDMIDYQ